MYDIQDEVARILNISFFDVEEISDADFDMITGGISTIVNNYAHVFADRQLRNEALYDKMIPSAQKEIREIKKTLKEQNEKKRSIRNRKTNRGTRF